MPQESDAVAEHIHLVMVSKFKGNGHGRRIHNIECKGYIKKGIRQIQLKAVNDGILVWPLLGFKYESVVRQSEVWNLFIEYLGRVYCNNDYKKACDMAKKVKTPKQMKMFCIPADKQWFTAFLYEGNRIAGIPMYKDLESSK